MDRVTETIEGLMHIKSGDPVFIFDKILDDAIELLTYMPKPAGTTEVERVKHDLKECLSASCRGYHPGTYCPHRDEEWDIMRDAMSVIESLSSNEGAIEVLRSSGWMQNHDHEMTADGTLFMKWLAELMLNTDDEPIKPSEIINRIDQGGFSRFVDDWKDGAGNG